MIITKWTARQQRIACANATLDLRVIVAIQACQPRATGYTIQRYLRKIRRRRWWFGPGPGVIYASLVRLEHAGVVESAWGEASTPGGPRPRLYYLTTTPRSR